MKMVAKISSVVTAILFLAPGIVFAISFLPEVDSEHEFYNKLYGPDYVNAEYLNNNYNLGAMVRVDWEQEADGTWTTSYEVENIYFDPSANNFPYDWEVDDAVPPANIIASIDIVIPADLRDEINSYGIESPGTVDDSLFKLPPPGCDTLLSFEFDAGVVQGEYSPIFYMNTNLGPPPPGETLDLTTGTLMDSGEGESGDMFIPLTDTGGGGATVPEPATLFLLGSGLLGLVYSIRERIGEKHN